MQLFILWGGWAVINRRQGRIHSTIHKSGQFVRVTRGRDPPW